tara:strand:- start:18104 stop:19204 length:1101 start_codon:yes stop_codon:yes gene_type:complete
VTCCGKIPAALALMALIIAGSFVAASPARADYRFCNATSYVLQAAIGQSKPAPDLKGSSEDEPADPKIASELAGAPAPGIWTTQGWTRILPGDCETALAGPLIKDDYYVFAHSVDAHQGATKFFSGSARFCTLSENFKIEGRDNCAMRGYDSHDFIRVAVKATDEWTTTFGEPRDYSLSQARIAGAQRLLKDNGLKLPKIDGYSAKNTQRAVTAFQRTSGQSVTGMIDRDLIVSLLEGAEKEQAKFGLNLCNKTPHLVWAAIGVGTDDDDVSSGWIRVPPQQCAKAIKDKLGTKPYYIYAEATDNKGAVVIRDGRRLVWSGAHRFCVKTTRFEITGREACATRGYDERAFMKVETGGKGKFDLTFE